MDTGDNRNFSIDFARCLACLGVVCIHVLAVYWYTVPIPLERIDTYSTWITDAVTRGVTIKYNSLNWYLASLMDAIVRFSVPMFVMISGALILNKKEISLLYIRKKILHIIYVILFWGGSTCYSKNCRSNTFFWRNKCS